MYGLVTENQTQKVRLEHSLKSLCIALRTYEFVLDLSHRDHFATLLVQF